MTFDEYVRNLRSYVDRFEQEWKEYHSENPRDWPLELPSEADRHEQFVMMSGDYEVDSLPTRKK